MKLRGIKTVEDKRSKRKRKKNTKEKPLDINNIKFIYDNCSWRIPNK